MWRRCNFLIVFFIVLGFSGCQTSTNVIPGFHALEPACLLCYEHNKIDLYAVTLNYEPIDKNSRNCCCITDVTMLWCQNNRNCCCTTDVSILWYQNIRNSCCTTDFTILWYQKQQKLPLYHWRHYVMVPETVLLTSSCYGAKTTETAVALLT